MIIIVTSMAFLVARDHQPQPIFPGAITSSPDELWKRPPLPRPGIIEHHPIPFKILFSEGSHRGNKSTGSAVVVVIVVVVIRPSSPNTFLIRPTAFFF